MAGTTDRYRRVPTRPVVAPNAPGPAARLSPPVPQGAPPSAAMRMARDDALPSGATPSALSTLALRAGVQKAAAAGADAPPVAGAPPPPRTRFQARRFLPPAGALPSVDTYIVQSGDRIDILASKHLGDPMLYWMIADANNAMDVEALCRPGQALQIPAPTADIDGAQASATQFATGDHGTVGDEP